MTDAPTKPALKPYGYFETLTEKVSNWGRWGPDDQAGTLNFLTGERIAAARSEIRDGESVSTAQDISTAPRVDNPTPPQYVPFWSRNGDTTSANETLIISPHGWTITHLDALTHVIWKGQMYNGVEVSPYRSADLSRNSIMSGKGGIMGRGVLLDLCAARGKDMMEPGEVATLSDVEKALERQKCEILPGDIVYFRTGRGAHQVAHGYTPQGLLAGLTCEAIEWAHEQQISLFVCDGGMDAQPSEIENVRIPWHVATLVFMGAMLVDNADLEALHRACEQKKRWTFFTTVAPLRLLNGNSSPVNPIALF